MPTSQIYVKLPPGIFPARDWLTRDKVYIATYCTGGRYPTFFIVADDGGDHELHWTGGLAANRATWLYATDDAVGLSGPFKPGPPL